MPNWRYSFVRLCFGTNLPQLNIDAAGQFPAGAFPQSITVERWRILLRIISGEHRIAAGEMYSAMRVFYTWIGQTDFQTAHMHVDTSAIGNDLPLAFMIMRTRCRINSPDQIWHCPYARTI